MSREKYMKRSLFLAVAAIIAGCGGNTKEETVESENVFLNEQEVELEEGGRFDPIANENAVKGGSYTTWGSSFPKSLNMWLDYNSFSKEIMELLFEGLATLHSTENEPVGILAESWEVSDDKRTFTFKIHPKAEWSDGTRITAEDVQFYYDVMMNPENLTSLWRVDLKRFERPEVIDSKTIRIRASEVHWSNFWTAAGLVAFPKHAWQGKDFNKQNFEFPVVSGPYRIKEVKKNRYVSLERRPDWWGRVRKYNHKKYNFNEVRYKFMEDRSKALEAFKKGVFDAYAVYTSSIWMKKTEFNEVEKNWVARQRIYNKEPKGFQGIAINLRRDKFKDVRVREALSYLINRDLMNEKLMYNQYFLLNSYYPDLYPENRNPNVPLRGFEPDKARALLSEAGWKVDSDGILKKNGQPLEVTFITASSDQRHLNIYVEDLKSVGMKASIELLSWSTIRKRMDNHDFDLYWASWAASRLRDPEASWHSSTADDVASNNICGVADPVIDSLIEAQRMEMDLTKRNDILRELDTRLSEIVPYVLLWASDHNRMLYWRKFGTPKYVFDKYNREDAIVPYWYVDPEQKRKLDTNMDSGDPLDPVPYDVHYEE